MAKHYEALQRAEEERRRRVSGEPPAVKPVQWDTTPETAPKPKTRLRDHLKRTPRPRPVAPSRIRSRERADDGANEMNKRRISLLQPDSYAAEQFRTLRARIDSIATERPIKTLAITSANPDEGKSTGAINLAAVTSMGVGRKVLLIDCDLRRPKVHTSLGIEPRSGLGEILLGQARFDDAVVKADGLDLDVLPVRTPPPNPSELLASPEMRELLDEVKERYDQIILDTPACLGLPDAKTVTELCDGIILVVRADVTPRVDMAAVLEILDRRRVLGTLLNGAEISRQQYGYY
ncbi:MAG: CpsD/CapB family tyrosine-protein kinase [Deltaproteobacteria bacterium]|nr:CpsD/CapB family tyrosine-protein kinase [Deltaproteobacteria bacterium]